MAMLVVGAFFDPGDLELINQERLVVEKYLLPLDQSDKFDYVSLFGTPLEDIISYINKNKERIEWFHFSGHHDKKGVKLHDGKNFSSLVDQLLSCKKLKGVFINGCASKSTIDKLSSKVPICIGTYEPIYDTIAAKFSDLFYQKLNTVESWEDYDTIHEEFKLALANLPDTIASEEHKESLAARGGGSIEELEKTLAYYFISPENDDSKRKFNSIDDDKLIRDNPNQKLIEILDHLNRDDKTSSVENLPMNTRISAKKYINKTPLIFKEILKAFGLLDNDSSFGFEKLGNERYILIKNFFYTYLNLYRYSILSFLWDFSESEFKVNEYIIEVGMFSSQNIQMLDDFKKSLTSQLDGARLKYVKDLLASSSLISEGADLFLNKSIDHIDVEKYFYRLLAASKFLNDYQFISIYSRNYIKNRIEEEKYLVKYVHGITKRDKKYSKNDKVSYDCIYSIYLCHKDLDTTIVNLSPFYFDKNFIESEKKTGGTSGKIDLYVLKEKDAEFSEGEGAKFDYLSIYKPYNRISVEKLFLVKSIDNDHISFMEEHDDDDKINSEYNDDKSYIVKSLFDELASIIT